MLYEYKKETFSYEERFIEKAAHFRHCRIKFPSCFKTADPVNDVVYLDCFLPWKFKSMLIILPGLGMGPPQRVFIIRFAKKLAQNHIGVCILTLPYHQERTPAGSRSGEYFLKIEANQALDFFQQAVLDVIRTADFWHENFDIENLSIMGISLGSIISMVSMAKDKRINRGILVLSGGNFSKILWSGLLRFLAKKDCKYKECKNNFRELKNYKELENFSDIQNIRFPRQCMYYEPLVFAGLLKKRKVLMFNAVFDLIIPFSSTLELWRTLGKPGIYWFPTDHYSIFLFSRLILSRVREFLKS